MTRWMRGLNSGRKSTIVAWLASILLLTSNNATAQDAVFNKPIYDPASKSYFELVRLTKVDEPNRYVPSMNWAEADRFASRRIFKGVRGRLAIIKSADTHSFILMNLRPADYTWIGLRYFCQGQKLVWSNGEVFRPTDFKAWATRWDESAGVGCKERGYMSVAYTATSKGFRWVTKGGFKLYRDLLVEYPTGKP